MVKFKTLKSILYFRYKCLCLFFTPDTGYIYPSDTDCVIARDQFSPLNVPKTYAPLSTYSEPGIPILLIPLLLSFCIAIFLSISPSLLFSLSLSFSLFSSLCCRFFLAYSIRLTHNITPVLFIVDIKNW